VFLGCRSVGQASEPSGSWWDRRGRIGAGQYQSSLSDSGVKNSRRDSWIRGDGVGAGRSSAVVDKCPVVIRGLDLEPTPEIRDRLSVRGIGDRLLRALGVRSALDHEGGRVPMMKTYEVAGVESVLAREDRWDNCRRPARSGNHRNDGVRSDGVSPVNP